ncbi:MMPL family transporter [Herbiconiux sp. SYSU D00978]|uniref:MMPL family transporter n=1 Tax=Herbiconiux sp. SYSU D00978 TaxID=2812562 RepID=UPI001A960B72|nr:MMPL family transporter [Herbiconiux sp. SYSU D00978]
MATLLYRLGRFSFRRAWYVIAAWLLALAAVLGAGVLAGGQTEESFAIPGTESQEALDRLEAVFPQVAGASAQILLVAPEGETITAEDDGPVIDELVDEASDLDGVDGVVGPFDEFAGDAVNDDETMAYIQVQFDGPATDVTEQTLEDLTALASIGEDAGLRVEFGGQVFQDNTFGITITEVFGVIFAAVVLLITFGSLAAAGMPLLSALIGVGIVMGAITLLSAVTTVSSTAPLLALMIGLAVGIDYALFIVSRHRTQLARGMDPEESAAVSVGTAGSAVVFAGVTVIIALLGLLVVGIPFLSVMGVTAAIAVLLAIAVATTLLPALLGLAGGRLAPKPGSRSHRRAVEGAEGRPTMGRRWVRGVMRHPVLASVGVVAVLGTLAIPALSLDLNLPDNGSEPAESTQRQAYDLIGEGFGPGYNGPLIVAVDITQTTDVLEDLKAIGGELDDLDDVAFVSQGIPDPGLDTAIIRVIPESGPADPETKTLVQSIRELAPQLEDEYGTEVWVTGTTAVSIDISQRLSDALLPFGVVVVGLSVVLLLMVFRSIVVPVKAALGFLLSVVASFGVVVAIFQWGWGADLLHVENPGPILSFMPIILMAVLFGLAMDYEVFLVSGMREEFVHGGDPRRAVEEGFAHGARVVTAAALIMFFVFFAFVPEGSGTIKPIALGLAAGIAFDAFLVRMTLVPAVMTLLGRSAWWLPRGLARVLPNVDIEGESLGEHRAANAWAADKTDSAITAEGLVAGAPGHEVGPLDVDVPPGGILLLDGSGSARRIVGATLAGRLEPLAGSLQVAGHPLPSESGRVGRLVAMASLDLGGDEARRTVGDVLGERLALRASVLRSGAARRQSDAAVQAVRDALASAGHRARSLGAGARLADLPALERTTVLAAAAILERTPVVVLDQPDALPADEQSAFLGAVSTLAAPGTTLVLGTSDTATRTAPGGRPVRSLDISEGIRA